MNPKDEPELTERQALISEVLLGTRSRTDPMVVAACSDPSFASMLDALAAVQQQLDRTAAAELAAGREPRLPRDSRLGDRVRQHLRPRRRWTLGLCLAVAALALFGVWLSVGHTPETPRYQRLNGDGQVTCEPGYTHIRWSAVPGARRYRVKVRSPDGDGILRIVESSPELDTNEWRPELAANYGPWIEVKVVVPGVEDDLTVHVAEFWRSGQQR